MSFGSSETASRRPHGVARLALGAALAGAAVGGALRAAGSSRRSSPSDWSRKRPAMAVREVAQKAGLEPLFRSQVRTKVEGLDVLDRIEGPVIFAANHASHLDTPLILLSLPDEWRRRTAVAAAADYFFDTWWRAVGSSLFFNTFPIDRRGGSMATTPGEVLADGWSLVIFPEGTRSKDGWMGNFRMGAAFLAARARRARRAGRAPRHLRRDAARPGLALARAPPAHHPLRRAALGRARASRCATSRPGSRPPSPRSSTRTGRPGGRRAGAPPPAPRPTPSGPAVAQWRRVWEQSESPSRREPGGRLRAWTRRPTAR